MAHPDRDAPNVASPPAEPNRQDSSEAEPRGTGQFVLECTQEARVNAGVETLPIVPFASIGKSEPRF
jgi:hypothetical protein